MKACFLFLFLSLGILGKSGEGMVQAIFQENFDTGTSLKEWIGGADWTVEAGRLKHAPVESLKKESLFLHEVELTDLEYRNFEWTVTVRNEGVNSSNYFRFCLLALGPDAAADMIYFKVSGTDGSDFRFVIRENGKEKVFNTGIRWDKTKSWRFSIAWDEWGVQVYQQQIGQTRSVPVFTYSVAELPLSFCGKKLYSGVIFNYSSTGQGKFFLDDLKMTAVYKTGTFSGMQVVDGKGILLKYTLPLKTETYRNLGNYQVFREGSPVIVDSIGTVGRNAVLLYLPLLTGKYTVTTQNLETVAGDDVDIHSETVSYISPALPGDLCINEIMFAPKPEMFFDREYIEIYNRRDYALRLDSVKYVYRGENRTSIQDTIGGNGFLLLCSKEAAGLLSRYGKTVEIPSFGLLDAGASVGLADKQGTFLGSLTYDPLWVRDKDKRKGYALEKIYPDRFDGPEPFNWYESQAFEGGTPGKQNSVKGHCPDEESPRVTDCFPAGDSAFVVVFNETMYWESLNKRDHYTLTVQEHASSENPYSIERIETAPDRVSVICRPALLRNRVYRLALSGLSDLSGNFLRDTVLTVLFPGIPEPGDVVISEFLFQAVPAGNRYVELYNRSDKKICPEELKIGIWENKTNRLEQLKTLPSEGFVLEPGEFCWVCSEREAILQQYIRHREENCLVLPTMPVFPASGGTIVLIRQDSVVIDSFSYSPALHRSDVETTKGVALERLHLEKKGGLKDVPVWTSAGGDTVAGLGSPGLPNRAEACWLPKLEVSGDSLIRLRASVALDREKALQKTTYHLILSEGAIYVPDSVGLVEAREVRLYGKLETGIYRLQIDSCMDIAGGKISPKEYRFGHVRSARPEEIVFNEIMFHPSGKLGLPNIEYLELYNCAEKAVRLDSLAFYNRGRFCDYLQDTLEANNYLLLSASSGAEALKPYGRAHAVKNFSLVDTAAILLLTDRMHRTYDSVCYREEWVRDAEKQKGGYSLERIRLKADSLPAVFNWYESQAPEGGTPGKENSVKDNCPDRKPPGILRFWQETDTTFGLLFDESIYEVGRSDLLHYRLEKEERKQEGKSRSPMEIIKVSIFRTDQVRIEVPIVSEGADYFLTVTGLQDLSGNHLRDTVCSLFVPSEIEKSDVLINELMFEAVPPEAEYVELYNRSQKRFCLDELRIGKRDRKGNITELKKLTDSCIVFEPGTLVWVCSEPEKIKARYSNHGTDNCIVLSSLLKFPDQQGDIVLVKKDTSLIDEFRYDRKLHYACPAVTKGVALERLYPESGQAVWTSAGGNETSGYGSPGMPNRAVPDILTQVGMEGDSVVQVFYTVPIGSSSATDRQHYRLERNGEEVPIGRIEMENEVSVKLHLSLGTGRYELEVSGVEDVGGGFIPERKIAFSYVAVAGIEEIRINEIMYRPREGLGLPAAEYVELYNDAKTPVRLDSVRYLYRDTVIDVLCDTIEAESYLLLSVSANAERLKAYGRVCKVKNFSLIDTGACLMLITKEGMMLDSVFYRPEWIREPEKRKGGYALERIGMANTFPMARHWYASVAAEGGTPGRKNSIAGREPDAIPPEITACFFERGNTIRLVFSENLDKNSVINREHYFLEPDWGKPKDVVGKENEMVLTFQDDFPENQEYELQVEEVRDLAGNPMRDTLIRYYVFACPEPGEVLLSEILYEAEPADAEYIELYNLSEKRIRMSDLLLAKRGDITTGIQYRKLTDSAYVLEPEALVWLSYAPQKVMNRYLYHKAGNGLPLKAALQLNNSQGYIAVCFRDSTVLDELSYSRDLHRTDLSKTKGIALERIDYEKDRPEGWTSAGGDEEQGYGSPGLPNRATGGSRRTEETEPGNQETSLIAVYPEVFTPNADGYVDVVNICAHFLGREYILKLMIYSSTGKQIRQLADGLPIRRRECFSWDGTTENGRLLPAGIYVVYAQAVFDNGEKKVIRKVCVLSR